MSFRARIDRLIGWSIIGAFGAGFVASGFAIVHQRTRGKPLRGLILWASYGVTMLFTLPLGFFFSSACLKPPEP
jgi:hypothetical protein